MGPKDPELFLTSTCEDYQLDNEHAYAGFVRCVCVCVEFFRLGEHFGGRSQGGT